MGTQGNDIMESVKGIVVLSLFDGMSCGQLALQRAGHKVETYFASEVDKYALQVTMANFPNTIQLGDVRNVKARALPKIDLLIGGSPCQGFSFAGKGLNFEDERSKLFFEFVRIWEEVKAINPNAKFLLENVRMKYEYELVISRFMGIEPIEINSALLSAQNRIRLYWTNIAAQPQGLFGITMPTIPQPQDKGILLKHILEEVVDEKYYISDVALKGMIAHKERHSEGGGGFGFEIKEPSEKTNAILQQYYKDGKSTLIRQLNPSAESGGTQPYQQNRVYDAEGISPALMAEMSSGTHAVKVVAMRGRNPEKPTSRQAGLPTQQMLEERPNDGKTNTITSVQKDNLIATERIRRLTPLECERLQTVDDFYTKKGLSVCYQKYIFAGNENIPCEQFAQSKNVINQSLTGQLNSAINTIIGSLDTEQQIYQDSLLIKPKSATWKIVTGTNKQTSASVSFIISDGSDTEQPTCLRGLIPQKLSVNFAIHVLANQVQLECVTSIIKCGSYTETLPIPMKEEAPLEIMDISETPMASIFTEKLQKKKSGENLSNELRLSTTLTWINLIIAQTIWKFLPKQSTQLHINSSIELRGNLLELKLSYIEMGSTVLISDSARYKMLGNGWTVDVVAHIFSFLKHK